MGAYDCDCIENLLGDIRERINIWDAIDISWQSGREDTGIAERSRKVEKMNDLISRQWLMECVDEGWIKFDTEKDKNRYIHLVRDIAPSAQPEKVKCKKCRYVYYDKEFGNYWCNRKPDSYMVEEDGYCKWGK